MKLTSACQPEYGTFAPVQYLELEREANLFSIGESSDESLQKSAPREQDFGDVGNCWLRPLLRQGASGFSEAGKASIQGNEDCIE